MKILLSFHLRKSSFLTPFSLTISLKLIIFLTWTWTIIIYYITLSYIKLMIPRCTFLNFPNSWSTVVLPLLQGSFSFLFLFLFLFWESKVKMLGIAYQRFKIITPWVREAKCVDRDDNLLLHLLLFTGEKIRQAFGLTNLQYSHFWITGFLKSRFYITSIFMWLESLTFISYETAPICRY